VSSTPPSSPPPLTISGRFPGEPAEIAAYRRILGLLAQSALGERESTELIATWQPSSPRIERIMMAGPEPDWIVWQKSSYSCANGGCVEVGWRTSNYSTFNRGCV